MMSSENPNPYRVGAEVSRDTKSSPARNVHGIIWFFLAVGVMVVLSTIGRNVPALRCDEFFILSNFLSVCCSGIGLHRSCIDINKLKKGYPVSTLLNFIAFFLNAVWSLLIAYILSFLLFAWINL